MTAKDVDPRTTTHRPSASRRGFVLVLVLLYILLAGSLMLLTTTRTGQLVRTNRTAHRSIVLRQLIDSGRAWVCAQHDRSTGSPVSLDVADLLPPGMKGEVAITFESGTSGTMLIEARLQRGEASFLRTARFEACPAAP